MKYAQEKGVDLNPGMTGSIRPPPAAVNGLNMNVSTHNVIPIYSVCQDVVVVVAGVFFGFFLLLFFKLWVM